jgi:hypothetical protein
MLLRTIVEIAFDPSPFRVPTGDNASPGFA